MIDDSKNLMEKAYRQIKNMIFQQKIGPGQKLIYRDLSERLDMSKTPIMYALGRLEQEGFVELMPNLGYFVKELDVQEFENLFDVREALEVHAIAAAIDHQTPDDLENLTKRVEQHGEYMPPFYDRKKLVLDAEVHLQIALMSKNKVLVKQLRQIFEHIYLRYRVERMHPTRLYIASEEHHQIEEVIRRKDYGKAEKMIRKHIRAAKETMTSGLSREEEVLELSMSGV
ncbi:MAG: GntR family transcriptional regulator [Deltaproteobacteria bacterium]